MKNNCTVVILSYNVKDITDECVKSVILSKEFAQKKLNNSVKILVVDNGSTDGTVQMLRKKYKDVDLIELPKNLGPACGYNAGMKKAKNPYILLINSDVFLDKTTLYDSISF